MVCGRILKIGKRKCRWQRRQRKPRRWKGRKVEWLLLLGYISRRWNHWHWHIAEKQRRHRWHQHVRRRQQGGIRGRKPGGHVSAQVCIVVIAIVIVILFVVSLRVMLAAANAHTVEIAQLRKGLAHRKNKNEDTSKTRK